MSLLLQRLLNRVLLMHALRCSCHHVEAGQARRPCNIIHSALMRVHFMVTACLPGSSMTCSSVWRRRRERGLVQEAGACCGHPRASLVAAARNKVHRRVNMTCTSQLRGLTTCLYVHPSSRLAVGTSLWPRPANIALGAPKRPVVTSNMGTSSRAEAMTLSDSVRADDVGAKGWRNDVATEPVSLF